jgi:hypothetical protein
VPNSTTAPNGSTTKGPTTTTSTRTTAPSSGADSSGAQCATLISGEINFDNGRQDPATFYEWKLEFDKTQAVLTMSVGAPDQRQSKSIDFALDQQKSHGVYLCLAAVKLAAIRPPTGTSGPAASVTIRTNHPKFDKVLTAGIGTPTVLEPLVLVAVPKDVWNELLRFADANRPSR